MCWSWLSYFLGIATGVVASIVLAEGVGCLLFARDERQYQPPRRERLP